MTERVTKAEFINAIAEDTGLKKVDAERAYNAVFDKLEKTIVEGKSVTIPDFGRFEPVTKAARTMRSPQTGENIDVPERKSMKFKPLPGLRSRIDGK